MFNRLANFQHMDLKVPLFRRGGISEDLKSILITVRYSTSQFFLLISPTHLEIYSPAHLDLVYKSLESTNVHWSKFRKNDVLSMQRTAVPRGREDYV